MLRNQSRAWNRLPAPLASSHLVTEDLRDVVEPSRLPFLARTINPENLPFSRLKNYNYGYSRTNSGFFSGLAAAETPLNTSESTTLPLGFDRAPKLKRICFQVSPALPLRPSAAVGS